MITPIKITELPYKAIYSVFGIPEVEFLKLEWKDGHYLICSKVLYEDWLKWKKSK
jgi:hypothetical protein